MDHLAKARLALHNAVGDAKFAAKRWQIKHNLDRLYVMCNRHQTRLLILHQFHHILKTMENAYSTGKSMGEFPNLNAVADDIRAFRNLFLLTLRFVLCTLAETLALRYLRLRTVFVEKFEEINR